MRFLKRLLFYFLIVLGALILFVYVYSQMQKPSYSGTTEMPDLDSTVIAYFDDYGIPHIYGSNEKDVMRVLGYIHAKERLFQMELVRRVSSGRLSEIFGNQTLETDKFFRMLGIEQRAEQAARQFMREINEPWKQQVLAYIEGINQYVEKRRKRFEFLLLGIPKQQFSVKDIYLISEFMSFNFQMAFKTDILMTRIKKKWGREYLRDLGVKAMTEEDVEDLPSNDSLMTYIENLMPIQLWTGSNAWAVSPERSRSGKALFANDTHIGVQQPAVWYEAHVEYPGYNFYGSYLAGFPFPVMGHSRHHAWGLTILENDDLDFFEENVDPWDSTRILIDNEWEKIATRKEVIHVKDSADVIITCRTTSHGPVCSDVMPGFDVLTASPVALCWTLLKFRNNLPEVTYRMSHAPNMDDFKSAVSEIAAPGLNVVYADSSGNIAWYAAAKFVKRRPGMNPNVILDGSGIDDWLGYYDFSENPQIENPSRGVVLSANNPPLTDSIHLYPGYYLSIDRFDRINQFFHSRRMLDLSYMKEIATDETNSLDVRRVQILLEQLPGVGKLRSQIHERCADILNQWNGSHDLNDVAPVIYYKWLYHILHMTFADEMGEKDFNAYLKTHVYKSSLTAFLENDTSKWWDNVDSKYRKETQADILDEAFDKSVLELIKQFGPNPEKWFWKKVHSLEITHVLGQKKPLDKLFNIGPYPIAGGIETINNQSFDLNADGIYKVNLAPSMRRSLDFADPNNGYNVSPSGQSGNFLSRFYSNQTRMFVQKKDRKEMMNRNEIMKTYHAKSIFIPQR